ncbi:MAG: phage head-tail connector protein [Clostridia bacterium]|nr:phage head-tail connector protein [Clostridia bacterium]
MADLDMLTTVKLALGITGDYQDGALQVYIDEVNEYLRAAGVPPAVIGTQATAGTVARGVSDLWNYGAGEGKLSPYFHERVIQLTVGRKEQDNE